MSEDGLSASEHGRALVEKVRAYNKINRCPQCIQAMNANMVGHVFCQKVRKIVKDRPIEGCPHLNPPGQCPACGGPMIWKSDIHDHPFGHYWCINCGRQVAIK